VILLLVGLSGKGHRPGQAALGAVQGGLWARMNSDLPNESINSPRDGRPTASDSRRLGSPTAPRSACSPERDEPGTTHTGTSSRAGPTRRHRLGTFTSCHAYTPRPIAHTSSLATRSQVTMRVEGLASRSSHGAQSGEQRRHCLGTTSHSEPTPPRTSSASSFGTTFLQATTPPLLPLESEGRSALLVRSCPSGSSRPVRYCERRSDLDKPSAAGA
jgi:hypothetical protein